MLVNTRIFIHNEHVMKKLLHILIGLVLLIAIPITIYVAGQNQEIRKKAAPATTLTIVPSSITKKAGETFTVEITIDTGENQVVAAELHLAFDPAKLVARTIKNGVLFPNILSSGAVEAGKASITIGVADAKQPVRGTGTIAVVQFQALEQTSTPISIAIGPNSFIGGLGEGAVNVLAGTSPTSVTIVSDAPPAQTSPTPTPLPSPVPISDQSAGAAGDPSPSPTQATADNTTLTIIAPAGNDVQIRKTPAISGKASPGATVTVTVYSTPQTTTVTADENGNWSFTPALPLESGPHNVVASVTDTSGQTQTATVAFVVSADTAGGGEERRGTGGGGNVKPVSGTTQITILILTIGIAVVAIGVGMNLFASYE